MLSNTRMQTNDEIRRRNLEIAIKRIGTAAKLAEASSTSPAYLSQIRNRSPASGTGRPKMMGEDVARRIEAALGEPHGWMDTVHVYGEPTAGKSKQSDSSFDENVSPATMGSRPIPVISAVQAGVLKDMENPYEPGDGFAVEYTDDIKLSQWTFGLEVEGDSMLPRFRPGDRVIVDPEVAPNPGNFVVARNGSNQATLKKYRPRGMDSNGNTVFELVPLNDDYPTLRSDIEHLLVIGVVVELRQKMR